MRNSLGLGLHLGSGVRCNPLVRCIVKCRLTLCVPFTFVANVLLQYWPFGGALCPLVGYSQAVAVFVGAFTLVAISLDRHRAIVHPLRARLTRRQLIGAFVVIWAAALTMSLPVAALSRVDTQQTEDGTGTLDYCKEMCHL